MGVMCGFCYVIVSLLTLTTIKPIKERHSTSMMRLHCESVGMGLASSSHATGGVQPSSNILSSNDPLLEPKPETAIKYSVSGSLTKLTVDLRISKEQPK